MGEAAGETRLWERLGEMARGHAEVTTAIEKVAAFAYETRIACDSLEARLESLGAFLPVKAESPQAKLQTKAPVSVDEVSQRCEQLSVEMRAKMDKLRVDIIAEMRGEMLRALREDVAFFQQSHLAEVREAVAMAGSPARDAVAASEVREAVAMAGSPARDAVAASEGPRRENAPPLDALCETAKMPQSPAIPPCFSSTLSTPRCVGAPIVLEDGRRGAGACRQRCSGRIGDLRSAGDLNNMRLQHSKSLQPTGISSRQGPWREDSLRSMSSARSAGSLTSGLSQVPGAFAFGCLSDWGPSARLFAQPSPPPSARINHNGCALLPAEGPCGAQSPGALLQPQDPARAPQPQALQGAAAAGAAGPRSPAAVQVPQLPLAQLAAQQLAPEQPGTPSEQPVQHPEVQLARPPQPEQKQQPQQSGPHADAQQPPAASGLPNFTPALQQPGGGGGPSPAAPQAHPQGRPLMHLVQVGPNMFAAQPRQPLQPPQQQTPQRPPLSAPRLPQSPPQLAPGLVPAVPLSPSRQPPCSPEAARPAPVVLVASPGGRPLVRQAALGPRAATARSPPPPPPPHRVAAATTAPGPAPLAHTASALSLPVTRSFSPGPHRPGSQPSGSPPRCSSDK